MTKEVLALIFDHEYQHGGPTEAGDLIGRIDMARRLLEREIPLKQISTCTLALDLRQKQRAFAAINRTEETLDYHHLKVNFATLKPFDQEFESWKDQQMNDQPQTT